MHFILLSSSLLRSPGHSKPPPPPPPPSHHPVPLFPHFPTVCAGCCSLNFLYEVNCKCPCSYIPGPVSVFAVLLLPHFNFIARKIKWRQAATDSEDGRESVGKCGENGGSSSSSSSSSWEGKNYSVMQFRSWQLLKALRRNCSPCNATQSAVTPSISPFSTSPFFFFFFAKIIATTTMRFPPCHVNFARFSSVTGGNSVGIKQKQRNANI